MIKFKLNSLETDPVICLFKIKSWSKLLKTNIVLGIFKSLISPFIFILLFLLSYSIFNRLQLISPPKLDAVKSLIKILSLYKILSIRIFSKIKSS